MAFDLCKFISFLISASLLFSPSVSAAKVDYCESSDKFPVKVKGIDIFPDPVVRGKPATFSISAFTDEAISGGKLRIEVRFFGIRVHSENHNLCKQTSCPVPAGDFVLSHTQTLPGYTPPGSYTLNMKLFDGSGHQLTCIKFAFKIGLGSPVANI